MYEFVRGPLVWVAFAIFFGGCLYKLITMFIGAHKEKSVLPTWNAKYGFRSLLYWMIPFLSRNTRLHPVMTMVSYVFHLCLLLTPLFVMGHAVLWQESWGISWWSLPPWLADVTTLVVIGGALFFALRRIAAPEVRNVTTWKDFLLLIIVVAPFVTGLMAHQHWLPYKTIVIVHIVSGAVWLIAIPFTWLSHMFWFVFTRSYMGSEFGAVRNARDW
ncbi:MAG: nitrate reductase [Deltaproteobacteria bacterium]|nr:nitrate reductase [Deltaproteobacteria bacterium]